MPTWLIPGSTLTLKKLLGTLMVASDNGAAKLLGDKLEEIYYQSTPGKNQKSYIDLNHPLIQNAPVMPRDQLQFNTKNNIPQILDAPLMTPEMIERLSNGVNKRSSQSAVSQMNAKAKNLKMEQTLYANESGLPTNWKGEKTNPENVTTAHDVVLLLQSIDKQHKRLIMDDKRPEQDKEITALFSDLQNSSITYGKEHNGKDHIEHAHQKLVVKGATNYLGDKYKILSKTGYIDISGYNSATSIKDTTNGHEVRIVVMGAEEANRPKLKAMNIGVMTFKNNDFVKGSVVRDAIVKKVAIQLLAKEQKVEKEHTVNDAISSQEEVGHVKSNVAVAPKANPIDDKIANYWMQLLKEQNILQPFTYPPLVQTGQDSKFPLQPKFSPKPKIQNQK